MSAQPPFSDATVLDVCFALDDIEMEIKYSVPKHCRNMPALGHFIPVGAGTTICSIFQTLAILVLP